MDTANGQSRPSLWKTISSFLIGLVLVMAPLFLLKLAVLPVLGLRSGLPPTDSIRAVPIEFAVTIVATIGAVVGGYWVYVRWFEQRQAKELVVDWRGAVFGLGSGMGLIGLPMLALYAFGFYELQEWVGFRLETLAIALVVGVAVVLEEIVFRGLLLSTLKRAYGPAVALFVQAVAFAAAHTMNENWAGMMPLVSTFLIGLLWGAFYLKIPSLWAVALHHAAWNLTIFASGLPLSGVTEWQPFAPLRSSLNGPEWLTGGLGGPELSILTPMLVVLVLVIALRSGTSEGLLRGR